MNTIDHYVSIAEASGRMVNAARSSDWEALVTAEEECARRIAALQDHQGAAALPADGSGLPTAPEAQERIQLLSRILAHDAEIRGLTEPWLRQLEQLLAGSSREHLRHSAYRSDN